MCYSSQTVYNGFAMEQLVLHSLVIGSAALEILQASLQGQVTGQTSGGIFLRTNADRILFLSLASWRGPLTINLSPEDGENLPIKLHSPFLIQAGTIFFPQERIKIDFNQAERWSPPPRPQLVLSRAEQQHRFAQVSAAVFAVLADRFEPGQDSISDLDQWIDPGFSILSELRRVLKSGQSSGIIEALVAVLGRGQGLTPAGDDIALGFLLALNRWGDRLRPGLPPEPINRALVDAARCQTTALSASLIECAARGHASERLVAALDGLVSGNLTEDRIVDHFRSWGHTSGVAAMQGMGLAFE